MVNIKQIEKRKQKDKELYKWYVDSIFHRGRAPTYNEVGIHLGVSVERARQLLNRLAKDGYFVKLDKRYWRDIYALRITPLIEYWNAEKISKS